MIPYTMYIQRVGVVSPDCDSFCGSTSHISNLVDKLHNTTIRNWYWSFTTYNTVWHCILHLVYSMHTTHSIQHIFEFQNIHEKNFHRMSHHYSDMILTFDQNLWTTKKTSLSHAFDLLIVVFIQHCDKESKWWCDFMQISYPPPP